MNKILSFMVAGVLGTSLAFVPSAAPAEAGPSDFNVENQGNYPFWVCRDWSADGWTNKDNCGSADTKYGKLRPGQSSRQKFGWDDTDGICFGPRLDGRAQNLRRLLIIVGWRDHGLSLRSGTHRRFKCLKARPLAGPNGVPKWRNDFRNEVSGPADVTLGYVGGGGGSW